MQIVSLDVVFFLFFKVKKYFYDVKFYSCWPLWTLTFSWTVRTGSWSTLACHLVRVWTSCFPASQTASLWRLTQMQTQQTGVLTTSYNTNNRLKVQCKESKSCCTNSEVTKCLCYECHGVFQSMNVIYLGYLPLINRVAFVPALSDYILFRQ